MSKRVDLTGQRFGRLTVVSRSATDARHWLCRCECGGAVTTYRGSLNSGMTTSCGCVHREMLIRRNRSHDSSNSVEHKAWMGMNKRCNNARCKSFARYGGRGIRVCQRWRDFSAFLSDVGPRPSRLHSLDRIDNNKGYDPSNVRWATPVEQMNNKRSNHRIAFAGRNLTLAQWSRANGFKSHTLIQRLRRGWSIERALTTP